MSDCQGNNETRIRAFLLLGLSNEYAVKQLLFGIFSLIYIFTTIGNITIIIIVTVDSKLNSPMYFFLRNLSLTEIFYISVTVPRMLKDFLHHDNCISFIECAIQLYFFCFLGTTECFTLGIMAYDRCVAICSPLLYTSIMTKTLCLRFVIGSFLIAIFLSMGQITFVFSLPFCGPNTIDHYFCDLLPVVNLICADTSTNEITILLYGSLVIFTPFVLILISYIKILAAVLSSSAEQSKAYSTCTSHLTSVILFYGAAIITYLRTKPSYISKGDKILSLLYSVLIPMLNPLIYSLRNSQVKTAIKSLFKVKK
ncbi:olfactory receptor 10A7-like [Hyla sarda]|uniref:olfactory receptor 10A7-like n=1 Tax=Hyla sarda TaxID=327740 RepID=UPI0024C2F93F|nr:olfactory receptor 10A7-like [Hyla sarda]